MDGPPGIPILAMSTKIQKGPKNFVSRGGGAIKIITRTNILDDVYVKEERYDMCRTGESVDQEEFL